MERIWRCESDTRATSYCAFRRKHNFYQRNYFLRIWVNNISSPSIIRMIKSKRMRWAGHVARMGRRGMHIGYWWESQKGSAPWVSEMLSAGIIFTSRKWSRSDTAVMLTSAILTRSSKKNWWRPLDLNWSYICDEATNKIKRKGII
jgi:hypothetical protein